MTRLQDGRLLTSEVTGPGFGGDQWHFVLSKDEGKTWDHEHATEFYNPGRPINGRACPKTIQIDPNTIGTVFYDYSGCDTDKSTSGVFFLRTPLNTLAR